MIKTHDLRIRGFEPLPSPAELRDRLPLGTETEGLVTSSRREVEAVLNGDDDRLLVVVGPCSVHDPEAALDYARRLVTEAERHADRLLIVMRVYFEKPRTTVGLEGPDQRPALDGTYDVNGVCARPAGCCWTSPSSACRWAASSWSRSARSTSPTR